MESARTFLFILFAFLTFLLYQAWQEEHKPEEKFTSEVSKKDFNSLESANYQKLDSDEKSSSLESALPNSEVNSPFEPEKANKEEFVTVITDNLRVLISTKSGDLISAELLKYKRTLDENSLPINIVENRESRVFRAQSGVFGHGAPDQENIATYKVDKTEYVLDENENNLSVKMHWVNEDNVKYTKEFVFSRESYLVDVKYHIENGSVDNITNSMFLRFRRDGEGTDYDAEAGIGMQSYLGFAYSTDEEKYEKYEFSDMDDDAETNSNRKIKTNKSWISVVQHYFVTAWIPSSENNQQITSKVDSTRAIHDKTFYQIRLLQSWKTIVPGQTEILSAKLYIGPKIQKDLKEIAEGLDLAVDYGFLWWIGQPISYLLMFFQGLVINWGLAIILVTVAIKTLLYPLARAQYRSFAKMRLLQPKMTAMKERYGDDKQQMSQKMMELYKKEKVNPLGGCFPLLIQMPVFIALYWVLMELVELRHAPFMLWINDLSVQDPYYVLPLLMGASMFLMQKMQPTSPTMDPMQAKMLQMMPVFMTVFFVFFPAGLVLYWLFNNLISIAQQLYITNQFNREVEAKAAAKKK